MPSTIQMQTRLYPASERGTADYGWLKPKYSFSFSQYYDPSKMGFGALRVLNDDIIAPRTGFPNHPHDNMEIVTIILQGGLKHNDNTGQEGVIRPGDVQIMSAGTGIFHSEVNAEDERETNVLQVWVLPKERNIAPRYAETHFDFEARRNELVPLVSPAQEGDSLWINQDAYFNRGRFDAGQELSYRLHGEGQGAYLFLIEGELSVGGHTLDKRDALGVWEAAEIPLRFEAPSDLLLIEVPMQAGG